MNKVIAVGMSGGVDSSVAALLLKNQGYKVIGVMMRTWDGELAHGTSSCYGPEEDDLNDARLVCKKIGVPFYDFDLRKEYRDYVLEYVKKEYSKGRTPNPCIMCNAYVKCGFLLEKINEFGLVIDKFATGHYARVEYSEEDGWYLRRGVDGLKDQSYFLAFLSKPQLSRLVLPLGNLTKIRVRKIAKEKGLLVQDKVESQDFMSKESLQFLLKGHSEAGLIRSVDGEVIGTHDGIVYYTVGQRKGLQTKLKKPLYVITKNPATNTIVAGERDLVTSSTVFVTDFRKYNSLSGNLFAQIRSNQKASPCKVFQLKNNRAEVVFKSPQFAVSPGQAIVIYKDDIVVGAGIIE